MEKLVERPDDGSAQEPLPSNHRFSVRARRLSDTSCTVVIGIETGIGKIWFGKVLFSV